MGKPDPPQPPNPITTAAAQTGSNVSTAVANAMLNNVNQSTPQGSLNYDVTGGFQWNDPTTGQSYTIPRLTATQTLSPEGQATLDESTHAKYNLARLSNTESGNLNNLLGSNIDVSGAPRSGNADYLRYAASFVQPLSTYDSAGEPQTTFDPSLPIQSQYGVSSGPTMGYDNFGSQQTTFDDAGPIQRNYGDGKDALTSRSNVENSLFSRMQPQNDRDLEKLRSQLADQGIRYGSQAYTAAMDNYNRGINDQRLAITAQGGQEQKLQEDIAAQHAGFANAAEQQAYLQAQGRGSFANAAQATGYQQNQQRAAFYNTANQQLEDMAAQRAGFANAAQKQTFDQAQARAQFGNTAQSARYQQNALKASFANSAAAQRQAQEEAAFNAENAARSQYLSEQYALRNQPINEVTALLSGSQVNNPNFVNTASSKIPTTDVAGLINTNFSQNLSNYQQQSSLYQSLVGGLIGAAGNAGGAYLKSDVRSKKNIHRIGSVMTAVPQKVQELPVYSYSYKDDPASTQHVGPMAQDVEKIDPRAVARDRKGTKYIDRNRVMGGILKAA